MKRFFAFLVIVFAIGLACSFVPLTLSIPLHRSPNSFQEAIQYPLQVQDQILPLPTSVESLSKGDGIVSPSPEPTTAARLEVIDSMNPDFIDEGKDKDPFQPVYSRQMVEPVFTTNFAHPESGCDWKGIAGQVFDIENQPVDGLVVSVLDQSKAALPAFIAYSGLAPQYGPGGYEIVLGSKNNGGVYLMQLMDSAGSPLSTTSEITIPAGCDSNLVIINFIDQTNSNLVYLPLISQ